jgi:integrase
VRKGDGPRREIQPFTREEAHTFLTTVETGCPEYYAFFLCALRTGMRLGELLALQWRDVNLRARSIDVQRTLVSGKLTTPKNRNRRRVDMSKTLAARGLEPRTC